MSATDAGSTPILRVVGDRILAGDTPVVLRGFGLGGSLNMENFITGHAGSESQTRRALLRSMGEESYSRFFDRFLDAFFTDADAAKLAELGLNSLRVPFNYRHFEDDAAPFEIKESGFRLLDRIVDACARHGIYTILDLHAVPGAQNQHWHSDNPTQWAAFWGQRQFQDRVVNLWERIAEHYRGDPWVAGYNPVNEPGDTHGSAIGPFYRRLEAAIRAVDPDHILFLDGNRYSTQFDQLGDPLPNCVYTAHDYALPGFVDGGPYPGVSRGQHVDRDRVEETFLTRTAYMRETGTPIWVGEFGPVYTGDPERDEQRYRLLQDQLDIYRAHGASWALWTYKDVGLQGLAVVDPASEYLTRIAPVLEKKARLGVDSWGSTDHGVRGILDPIERLFREEFPDFQPYPWGAHRWIHGHVRHVILAEAMVDEYARRFEGVTPDEAERLAAAFDLENCLTRERLADILRADSSAR
ncbi:aryl-phospho-beta-D-glucosidase BglC (GH1 family) [Diaminobutyricimonas aerilata]|uniref:Aryl-phospho-beta-D-glucosidase BglC (GH1 family) n=1 Tax=Diaminobutyricimonas aerilata TaxID=1162967 RepID=A0A2M9CG06_9MICO|nr:cellulase family glycosylhydrolase [Diaminobutyricimonas aerilata]PJJ70808.1 aryl-phospho-beta-D-glucosidase BglC (GH1 family) [Diaminobutyricimonas aerilata]